MTESNLQYIDFDYGVRIGFESEGPGLDGDNDFRIYQYPLHLEEPWPYGGEHVLPGYQDWLTELITTHLFDMVASEYVAFPDTWFVKMEDPYTIRGWRS